MFVQSIFEAIFFILAVFVCFYIPGTFFVAKLKYKVTFLESIFLSSTLGLFVFTLVAYVLSWSKLSILILPIFLAICFFAIKNKILLPDKFQKKYIFPLVFIIIFAILFSTPLILNGVYGDTIRYGKDELWHLALINELKANFPPDNPAFAGIPLKGYHFFFNFLLAKVSNIFYISPLSLYFHFFPLLLAVLWGLGVYILMVSWTKKNAVGLWAVFLTMFGGSFGFFIKLQGHPKFDINSGMGIMQPVTSIVNPPFTISIIIILSILFSLNQYLITRKRVWLFPIALGVGLVSMFKVYAGIILIGGFMALAFFEVLRRRFEMLIMLALSGVLFLCTYWFFRDPTSRLIFYPFWAPHNVIIDQFPWYGYTEKQYTYSKLSVIRGLVEIEAYAFGVFILGNLGTRFIGILASAFYLVKRRKFPSLFALTLFMMTLISFLIPLLFIQSGKVFEIIQMAWYFLFFSSLFASVGLAYLFSFKMKKIIKIILIAIIIIATLPSTYSGFWGILTSASSSGESWSSPYHKAMKFLQTQGNYNQAVLEIPPLSEGRNYSEIMRWYKTSTPAIVSFSNKKSFLNCEFIDFYGVDVKPRILFLQKLLYFNSLLNSSLNYESAKKNLEKELIKNKIVYIYSPYSLYNLAMLPYIKQIYQDGGISIHKVSWSQ